MLRCPTITQHCPAYSVPHPSACLTLSCHVSPLPCRHSASPFSVPYPTMACFTLTLSIVCLTLQRALPCHAMFYPYPAYRLRDPSACLTYHGMFHPYPVYYVPHPSACLALSWHVSPLPCLLCASPFSLPCLVMKCFTLTLSIACLTPQRALPYHCHASLYPTHLPIHCPAIPYSSCLPYYNMSHFICTLPVLPYPCHASLPCFTLPYISLHWLGCLTLS